MRLSKAITCGLILSVGVWVASLALPSSARAGEKEDKERARTLFIQGAEAVEAGRAEGGLPLLLEAESLFHAPTHLLYIARAQAATGKLLEARQTYKRLAAEKLPAKASRPFLEAQATGKTELAALEARIPRVVVEVEPEAAGLQVTLDSAALPRALGEPVEVDPGDHTVAAKAPGYLDAKVTVAAPEGRETVVHVVLSPIAKSGGARTDTPEGPAADGGPSGLRIASIALMAVGGAGLAAGGAMGIVSLLKTSDADDRFETCGLPCKGEIESLDQEAATLGTASIIGLSAGAAVLATGIVLFVLDGDDAAPPQSGSAHMIVGPSFIGVGGTF